MILKFRIFLNQDCNWLTLNTKLTQKLNTKLKELEKIKVQLVLVLQYKKVNDCNGFHSSIKLIASDSDIDEAFESLHQSIMI